jgi:hypothetical protein
VNQFPAIVIIETPVGVFPCCERHAKQLEGTIESGGGFTKVSRAPVEVGA